MTRPDLAPPRRPRRRARTALALALALLTPACTGPFQLTSSVHELNTDMDSKWTEELVFLCFTIVLPVYELAILVDVLVLNPIDFWFERSD